MPLSALLSARVVSDWHQTPSDSWLTELKAMVGQQAVHRIVVFRTYLHEVGMAVAGCFPNTTVELDMDDLESSTRRSLAACFLQLRAWRSAVEFFASSVQYALLQCRVARAYDKVWLAAPEDAKNMIDTCCGPVDCRPNRLAQSAVNVQLAEPSQEQATLLFVGGLDYAPNQQAVVQLVDEICPRLQQQLALPWEMRVIGRRAPDWLVGRMNACGPVRHLSDESCLQPHYAQAQAVVVPVFYGGGTKFKTIEALAYARPVITTSEGARGLGLVHRTHCFVANTPEQFAQAVVQLVNDPAMARNLGQAGERHYQKYFSITS